MNKNEKKLILADLQKMKPGDQVVASLLNQDMAMAFSCKMKEDKYPIGIQKTDDKTLVKYIGKQVRSLGLVDGKMKYVSAEEEGCSPTAKVMHYSFIGFGTLEITDCDFNEVVESFNVRLITKAHPKYSTELTRSGKEFAVAMNVAKKMFGKDWNA